MVTTAQAMASFLAGIEPTAYQSGTLIPARKDSVVENLTGTFPAGSDMPFWKANLIGSAAKDTIIRPIDDIDLLAVFSDENNAYTRYRYDSRGFLYRIREAYNDVSIQQVGARGQAVRVFFQTGGHVDVAPVFFAGAEDYLLPAGDGAWLRTSPFVANQWLSSRNADLGYHLKPVIRLLKRWNREHSSYFKSFHLETVVASVFSSLGSNYRDSLTKFFRWAPNHLPVVDPGGHGGDLSSYLTWQRRQNLLQSLSTNANRADRALLAERDGDHAEAKRLWSIILGSDFPIE
jgi:Second Messenger Oligonucleotide or Dinucleotide Synthetase domain